MALFAFSICIENQKTNGILDAKFWISNSLNLSIGKGWRWGFFQTIIHAYAIFLTQRHEGTKFFVSRKARKGAKTQGNKE